MMLEVVPSAAVSYRSLPSHGTSDTAWFVAEQATRSRGQLQKSFTLGLRGKGTFDELYRVYEECLEPNWDGYGALPITDAAYHLTSEFLEALPLGTPAPSLGAEPDGHLTVEWYRSPRRTLSVSISQDGELHFAALLGSAKTYGTEPFVGEVPKIISDLINRVMAV